MTSEDLSVELEALRFTYAEALTLLQEEPMTVKVASAPYTGGLAVYISSLYGFCTQGLLTRLVLCVQVTTVQSSLLLLTSSSQRVRATQSAHQTSACAK